jgi:D-alanyl-D-alanine carboxypeptidase/D-alanyl-D-alanine-endopeptidase (penicillin-binding protein 4)
MMQINRAALPKCFFLIPYLGLLLALIAFDSLWLKNVAAQSLIPTSVERAIKRSGIHKDSISIAVTEIPSASNPKPQARTILSWRDEVAMNPASTIKLLTTLVALDILGPKYRWKTELFTDGEIKNGTLKGNLYFVGHGDPKWIPEELAGLTKQLRELGVQRIDGNLIFDRSAYAQKVMEESSIDGETLRAYNVPPDPLLYAFRTLSFQINPNKAGDAFNITYTPKLTRFTIQNEIAMSSEPCDGAKRDVRLEIIPNPSTLEGSQIKNKTALQWRAVFTGELPQHCRGITFNIVKFDPDTFLTLGFTAAWEDAGGRWLRPPRGQSGLVPVYARPLLVFEGLSLFDAAQDINKLSNNVMARQVFLTLALEKIGKPADISSAEKVVQAWLDQRGLHFPELVIENGSGLSRNEAISARHLNSLLISAQNLPIADVFTSTLPAAGTEGTVRNRLINQLRKFLHLKKKPEVRIKTGSLNQVRTISGYVFSKSGRIFAVTSFINDPKANRGQEIHDQLLTWLLEDGPEPNEAR